MGWYVAVGRTVIERYFRYLEFPAVLALCYLLTRDGVLLEVGAVLLPTYAFARGLWRYHTEVSGFADGALDPRAKELLYGPLAGVAFLATIGAYVGAIAWFETQWWWAAPMAVVAWVFGLRLGAWVAHRWHYDPAVAAGGD
jgi:hypothetical protein